MEKQTINRHEHDENVHDNSSVAVVQRDTNNSIWKRIGDSAETAADLAGRVVTRSTEIGDTVVSHGMNAVGNIAGIGATVAGGTMRLLNKARRNYTRARGADNVSDSITA